MATNVLFSEGAGEPALRDGPCPGTPDGVPTPACSACGEAGHACGAMPAAPDGCDVTLACTWCFLMPLVVVLAAVVLLYDAMGEAVAFLIGAAAWIVLLQGGKFVSRIIRAHRSGE